MFKGFFEFFRKEFGPPKGEDAEMARERNHILLCCGGDGDGIMVLAGFEALKKKKKE